MLSVCPHSPDLCLWPLVLWIYIPEVVVQMCFSYLEDFSMFDSCPYETIVPSGSFLTQHISLNLTVFVKFTNPDVQSLWFYDPIQMNSRHSFNISWPALQSWCLSSQWHYLFHILAWSKDTVFKRQVDGGFTPNFF